MNIKSNSSIKKNPSHCVIYVAEMVYLMVLEGKGYIMEVDYLGVGLVKRCDSEEKELLTGDNF